jgi:hypothetical protein
LLTIQQILAWADEHHARTGAWPMTYSGAVAAAPEQNWRALDEALRHGCRGLPGGDSLSRLLGRERGVPDRRGHPPNQARRKEIAQLRSQGLTLAEIGRRYGISRQAVFQLLQPNPSRDAVA